MKNPTKVYWDCGRKKAYPNLREAYTGVRESLKDGIAGLKPYRCPHCNLFHNATVKIHATKVVALRLTFP